MLRRTFLQSVPSVGALGHALSQTPVVAGASQDITPRVGIVLSSFTGSEDHDGTKIAGLAEPAAVDAELSASQIDAMLRKAIFLGTTRRGGLTAIVGPEDWVVIKPRIRNQRGNVRGGVTDIRIVRSLIEFLVEHKCGGRFTIAEGSDERSGGFDELGYEKLIADFSQNYPKAIFDRVDLNIEKSVELPVHGKALAGSKPAGTYFVPQTIQECDRIISVAPLATDEQTGVALSIANYWGIAPGERYGYPKTGLLKLGRPDEVVVDLFSYHPADYAIVGGSWGVEGGSPSGPDARSVHHNVLVAGPNAVSVDALGAAVMGFEPTTVTHLRLAERRGFGYADLGPIWTRGNDIDEARHEFRKPANWKPSSTTGS